jgi:hypothetical protein
MATRWREMREWLIGWTDSVELGAARVVRGVDAMDRHEYEDGDGKGEVDEKVDEDEDEDGDGEVDEKVDEDEDEGVSEDGDVDVDVDVDVNVDVDVDVVAVVDVVAIVGVVVVVDVDKNKVALVKL